MTVQNTNIVVGIVLLAFGLWGAMGATSPTAWIAPAVGAILLILHPGFIKESKIASHVVVLLTALIAGALLMPLIRTFTGDSPDMLRALRIGIMFLVAMYAMIKYIGYFRAIRKAREAGE